MSIEGKAWGRELEAEGGGHKTISNLSFGLPPFGRVPGFGLRIANLKDKRQEAEGHDAGTRRYGDAETGRNGDAERKAGKLEGR